MMKMTVNRKHNVIKVLSKSRSIHSDTYWEDQASQNALLLLEDHAHLTIGSETQERLLLLSTDSLIIAKTKSLYLKLKARVSLSDIWLASCTHQVTSRKFSSKTSFVIGWPTTNYVMTLSSSEMKDKWLCTLQWHSVRARQRLIPHNIIMSVHLFDSVATTAVHVDVHSTAESVVNSVIQHNSLNGRVSDYQLCVLYNEEEEVYPLIGHELPYCILLHSLRGQRSQHMLSRQQWHSADELRGADEANKSTVPRFILKRRDEIHTHAHTGPPKHKRKKSLIGWALRKGHVQSEEQTDLQPASNKLFGQSLSSVCPDGNLPKPIMELLCMLYRDGPGTLGIFRRSANARSCRILKEQLNLGHGVCLHGESVFVAASLLTEFLRKLPDSILGCYLYEEWIKVMVEDDQQCRCSSVKSVLAKLPQVNRTLLCYVFGVLHHIHTHSDVNQMTASNLALCIAPNMLWRATSPEQDSQSTLEVAALVRFLIENTPSIFGNEAEDTFTMLSNTAQENEDLTADASLPRHSSSEETDLNFLPSLDLEPFLPLSTLSLSGHRKFIPFNAAMEMTDGAYSDGTLDRASVQSISLSEFSQSRDRCLSEPSMFFDARTPTKAPSHPPVIRQSSCDNAIMDNNINQSQSPVLQGRSRAVGKGRYAFWKSPQFPARFRHPAQRLASMSSLSSTTTSSLSSLDSFEHVPSLSDDKPRPFLFGSSARLRPLTPEMPKKLWMMAFNCDELKDGTRNRERDDEKASGVLDTSFMEECKAKDEPKGEGENKEEGERRQDRSGVMEVEGGKVIVKEPETCCHVEGISPHMLLSNENQDLGTVPTITHTQPCPIDTQDTRTLHTDSLTLPSKRDKTSRMKITLLGSRMFKQTARVTVETGVEEVTVTQVNVPKTLFYNQNMKLVLQSEGRQCETNNTDDVCMYNDIGVSRSTDDGASRELSISTTKNDVSQIVNQRVSINTSATTGHKISINLCNTGNTVSTPATTDYTVNISGDSTHVSQNATSISHKVSPVSGISDVRFVSYRSKKSISTTDTSINDNKISQGVSTSASNTTQCADTSAKTSVRQTIRIRLPATVRHSVRAYFSPAHPATHRHTPSAPHTHEHTHTQTSVAES